jgi:hypothetical protein
MKWSWVIFPARQMRFPARWLPVKLLQSRNKLGVLVVDILRKKVVGLVFQMAAHSSQKASEKVAVQNLQHL